MDDSGTLWVGPIPLSGNVVPPEGPKGTRREIFAWAMYDWANSAYSTLSITFLVAYLQQDVLPGNWGVIVWTWGLGGTMLVSAALSPIVGAIADAHASKRRWLAGTSFVGAVASCLMFFATPELPWLFVVLFLIANLGFELSQGFYNAFLPEIADDDNIGRVSAWGYALGYIGGALPLLLMMLVVQFREALGLAGEVLLIKRTALALMGLWWGLFTIPTIWILKDKSPPSRERLPLGLAARRALREVGDSIRNVRRYRILAIYLVAFLFFNDGVQTMISQSSTFAIIVLNMSGGELAQVVLMIQFIALPGSLLVGHLGDRVGHKPTLIGCLLIWIVLLVLAFYVTTTKQFWLMAAAAAVVLGGTQSVSRALMGLMTPPEKTAEFFGFFNLSGKAISMFGPILFGTILTATGSPHWAILSLLFFFVVGLGITLPLNIRRGQEQARGGQ